VQAKKRLFVGLSYIAFFVLLIAGLSLRYLVNSGYKISESLLNGVRLFFWALGVILAMGLLMIVTALITKKYIRPFQGMINLTLEALFPLAILMGRIFGIDKDRVRGSFIEVHNQLINAQYKKVKPQRLLLLLPHCLQWTGCPYKITVDPDNCRRCGRCTISSILDMRDEYGIMVGIASGGSQARRLVKELKPHAIIAVACERDLTSGIQDVNTLPVLGVINERPQGPCINTTADLEKIREAIDFFLN
jgi:hypothetical protein